MPSVELKVKVIPNSSRTSCVGWYGDAFKVKLQAPPESGKANAALVSLFSKKLNLPKSAIQILKGETAPSKILAITGLTQPELENKLKS